MWQTSLLLIALTFGISSNGSAQSKQKNYKTKKIETSFNKEQQKVLNTIEKMVSAFQNKDIDGVLATYEEDAIVMFEPQKPVQGKKALRTFFTQFVQMNPRYTFSGHEVYISGNLATHISPWKMVGQMPDGTKIEQNGLSIAILRKQPDGNWLMIQDNPHGQFLLNK
ncbi:YybH family protein [Aureispira anguillae]|nr:nuclear transport factor 2 family protein [Aureispira anguillae]